MKKLRIAYLVSRYPTVSHAFILREVCTLRNLNFDIKVTSIDIPDRKISHLTEIELEETKAAFYVKMAKFKDVIKSHSYTLLTQPWGYVKGLFFALRLGKTDIGKMFYGLYYFIEAVMIGHWMRQQQIPHLHVHFANTVSTIGLIVKKIFPISFSLTVHGPDEFYNTLEYYLTEKVINANFICCISYFTRSQLMMLSPPTHWDKFEVCHIGIDATLFNPRPFREKADPLEILCVEPLMPIKGQVIILEAMTLLISQGRHVRLRFVGEGTDRHRLEKKVLQRKLINHVIFEGAVDQTNLLNFYKQADILVLASFAEGLPNLLMEAMAMEIPCVTTHIAGIPELIRHGEEGMLVAPSDADMIARSIALLMDMPELRRQLGQAGRKRILRDYELQRNTKRLADIFQQRLTVVTKP